MAQNDIIVPKVGPTGVLSEIALTPADIGAASASHASTHHTGGTDAISASSIGAESIFDSSGSTLFGTPVTLTAARARVWTLPCFSSTTVTLPTTDVQLGDRIVVRGGSPVSSPITITSTGVSDQIYGTDEQFSYTYLATGTGNRWVKNVVDNHDANRISSGTFDNARINFAAPAAIGNTTPNSGAFTTLTANNGTLTASAPVLDVSQTWNNAAVTFTGLRFNATDTASAAESSIAEFQVGGTRMASFRKDGVLVFRTGNPAITILRAGNFSLSSVGNGSTLQSDGIIAASNFFGNGGVFQLRASNGQSPVTLARDDGDIFAQRNASNPQNFRLYGSYGASDIFERLSIRAQVSNNFIIATEKGTTGGLARGLEFQTDSVARLTIGSAGGVTVNTGNLVASAGMIRGANATVSPPVYDSEVRGLQFLSIGGTLAHAAAYGSYVGEPVFGIAVGTGVDSSGLRFTEVAAFTLNKLTLKGNLVLTDNDGPQTATFDAQSKLTANRTYDLPDASGTIALSNQLLNTTGSVEFQDLTVTNGLNVGTGGSVNFSDAASIALPSINTSIAIREVGNELTGTFRAVTDSLTANRTYDLPDSSGTIALLETLPAGGTKTYATFTALDNNPPATLFASLDSRNSIAVLDFDDASTESAVFVGVMPEAASLASGLIVRLIFTTTTVSFGSSGAGSVRWSVAFERGNTNLGTDSFDTAVEATVAINSTDGISGSTATAAITITTIDGITAGDLYRLRVQRIGGDAADSASGDAELVAVEIRSAA